MTQNFTVNDMLNHFENEIWATNENLLAGIKNVDNLYRTKEFISIFFSECIYDDLKFISKIKDETHYVLIIMRTTLEHVILYKYLMKNDTEIEKYLSIQYDADDSDIIRCLHSLGKKNTQLPDFKRMSEDINEATSDDKKMALYNIYKLLCNVSHNLYQNKLIELHDDGKDASDGEWENMLLIQIFNGFINTYNEVSRAAGIRVERKI